MKDQKHFLCSPRIKVNLDSRVNLEGLFKIESTNLLDKKIKRSLATKFKIVLDLIREIETVSGIKYPAYYVEPTLPVVQTTDNVGGLGILYARTIPVESESRVTIVVQLSAPLVLYGMKTTIRAVLAHELMHYVELVGRLSNMDVSTMLSSSSIFEELFSDMDRATDPSKILKDKKLVRLIKRKLNEGLSDEKLNEKCRVNWIEKGLPTVRFSVGQNQVNVSVEAIQRSVFDPKVKELSAKTQ